MARSEKTVLVFGTFDVIHPGHEWFLRKSRQSGDRLVAAVARDDFVREWKGHPPLTDEMTRIRALGDSGLVDEARLSDTDIRTYGVVEDVRPDVICLGHDQKALKDDLDRWLGTHTDFRPEIVVLRPWKRDRYSSTRRNKTLAGAGPTGNVPVWAMYVLMILAMVTFGFSWVSGKRISGFAPPSALALIRFTMTAFCFLPLIPAGRRQRQRGGESDVAGWAAAVGAAAALVLYNILFFSGLNAGLAGHGGLIVTTLNPLFTFLIVLAVGKRVPGRSSIPGLVLGIAGGVLLMRPWMYSGGEILDSGNLAFMIAALFWSVLTVLSRPAQAKLGFIRFNLVLYFLAALILLPVALGTGGTAVFDGIPRPGSGDPEFWSFWGHMLFISAATGAFGTSAYFMASSRLGAARGSAFTYLVPIFALLFTTLLLGETPDLVMILGGMLAVGAVMLINRSRDVPGA